MNRFLSEFNPVSKDQWLEKIRVDLKGKDPNSLEHHDPIEELDYSSIYHVSDQGEQESPGNFPFTRGLKTQLNDWKNTAFISVEDEKEANTKILHFLMTGADAIWIVQASVSTDWNMVLKDIQFEFIRAQFSVKSIEDMKAIQAIASGALTSIQFNFDLLSENSHQIEEFTKHFISTQQRFLSVNGFGIQQSGGTTWQEIAFCLNTGHEYLIQLMQNGMSIDEASACIGFHVGIGSNYFFEVAKIRSLRSLWSKIISAYHPKHACTYNCSITAIIGHTNKSLSDPHTNLLRQTTEAMSALNAGIENIVILPHDLYSDQGTSDLSERMAINIPLILKEESYLDKVVDPIGGSYVLGKLTEKIGMKTWSLFQELEAEGGLFNNSVLSKFRTSIESKRHQREQLFIEGEFILIGINKYPNPENVTSQWKKLPSYLGMTALNFELITKTISA